MNHRKSFLFDVHNCKSLRMSLTLTLFEKDFDVPPVGRVYHQSNPPHQSCFYGRISQEIRTFFPGNKGVVICVAQSPCVWGVHPGNFGEIAAYMNEAMEIYCSWVFPENLVMAIDFSCLLNQVKVICFSCLLIILAD